MERLVAALAVAVTLASCPGCGLGPRNFHKITHPAPLVRARAISLGYGQSDAVVIPALVGRLNDPDVVVRMAANEELKKRTGRDLGFVPWASPEERAGSIARWQAWLSGAPQARPGLHPPARPEKSLPASSPQSR
jgi:hypothetical protein